MLIRAVSLAFYIALTLGAQTVFQFREAALLEAQMSPLKGEILLSSRLNLPGVDLLHDTDARLWRGDFDGAEAQYRKLLEGWRAREGDDGIDVAWMSERLGRSYLQIRTFEKAYERFFEAARAWRLIAAAFTKDNKPSLNVQGAQLHLMNELVTLGRLDFGKGNIASANSEFNEAVGIANKLVRASESANALYFRSRMLEEQGKWSEAEGVWQEAEKVRSKMLMSQPYWDVLREMAAFYARQGNFSAAAEIVRRIQIGTTGKHLRPFSDLHDRPDWFGNDFNSGEANLGIQTEGDAAMAEILAVDKWITGGAEAGVPLLSGTAFGGAYQQEDGSLALGSDSERRRLIDFVTQRAYLHMSILLDGQPSDERVQAAYEAFQRVKGRYFSAIADLTARAESRRNNPHVDYAPSVGTPIMLDDLASLRIQRSHLFVTALLHTGGHFDNPEFVRIRTAEDAIGELIAKQTSFALNGRPPVESFLGFNNAFIDIAAWKRIDRTKPLGGEVEFGAFVLRKGKPVEYIRLGPVRDVERDINLLQGGAAGVSEGEYKEVRNLNADEIDQCLRRLYRQLISPLEGSIAGAKQLLISPDRELSFVPMAALLDGKGRPLLERYSVVYVDFSLVGHAPHEDDREQVGAPIILADPDFDAVLGKPLSVQAAAEKPQFEALPDTGKEAEQVQAALHLSGDRVLRGKRATAAALRSAGGVEILHIATHSDPNLQTDYPIPAAEYDLFEYPATLDVQEPLLHSAVVLAGANRLQSGTDDGILTALEIASLRLYGTKLVVLSSCKAGQGRVVGNQGVVGLRAAFAMAGAQGVVLSLWPIPSEAGRNFMKFFYSHLKESPAEALRLAQQDMIADARYQDPRYWAGYTFFGDPDLRLQRAQSRTVGDLNRKDSKLVVSPACIEATVGRGADGYVTREVYRLKIAGPVTKHANSLPGRVTYELKPPSSDLEKLVYLRAGPKQEELSDTEIASHRKFGVSLTIERTNIQSALYVREYIQKGDLRYKPQQTVLLITLRGGAELFSSFELPPKVPPLASYLEASISEGEKSIPEKITDLQSCAVQ